MGLEHPQILVPARVLEPMPHTYQKTTVYLKYYFLKKSDQVLFKHLIFLTFLVMLFLCLPAVEDNFNFRVPWLREYPGSMVVSFPSFHYEVCWFSLLVRELRLSQAKWHGTVKKLKNFLKVHGLEILLMKFCWR